MFIPLVVQPGKFVDLTKSMCNAAGVIVVKKGFGHLFREQCLKLSFLHLGQYP